MDPMGMNLSYQKKTAPNHTRANPTNSWRKKVLSQVACANTFTELLFGFLLGQFSNFPSLLLVFYCIITQLFQLKFCHKSNDKGTNMDTLQAQVFHVPNTSSYLGSYPICQFEVPRHPHRLRWKSVQFPPGQLKSCVLWPAW